ncbi:MAG: Na+/H+ antiporter subunit E [Desulfurococcaceae archaeon]
MKGARLARALAVALLAFATYLAFTGSATGYDLVTGAIAAAVTGYLFSNVTISNPRKILQPSRWYYLAKYAARYFTIDETKAHVDVIKRILHPRVPVNPAIVEVPFEVRSDYAVTATANSITNTPGTVVVEVDEARRRFYVHWIDAKTLDPARAREEISKTFEEYCAKIFE